MVLPVPRIQTVAGRALLQTEEMHGGSCWHEPSKLLKWCGASALLCALATAACGHDHRFIFMCFSLSPQQTTETGDDEDDQPLSLAWPPNPRKQVTFLIVLPIVFPLWLTLPDVRKPVSKAFLNRFLV